MDKHPATPGMLFPAHELRADLLLAREDAAGALEEYQRVLRTDPNRFRSVLGTARAEKLAGDTAGGPRSRPPSRLRSRSPRKRTPTGPSSLRPSAS